MPDGTHTTIGVTKGIVDVPSDRWRSSVTFGLLVGVLLAPLVWAMHLLHRDEDFNRVVFATGVVTLVYSYAVGSFTLAFPAFMALFAVGFVLWAFWLGGALRTTTAAT